MVRYSQAMVGKRTKTASLLLAGQSVRPRGGIEQVARLAPPNVLRNLPLPLLLQRRRAPFLHRKLLGSLGGLLHLLREVRKPVGQATRRTTREAASHDRVLSGSTE